jgi:hypothetical protein
MVKHFSFKELSFNINKLTIMGYLVFAGALFWSTAKITGESYVTIASIKSATIIISFIAFIFLMEKDVRSAAVAAYQSRFVRG